MLLYVIPLLHSTLGSVKIPPSRHRTVPGIHERNRDHAGGNSINHFILLPSGTCAKSELCSWMRIGSASGLQLRRPVKSGGGPERPQIFLRPETACKPKGPFLQSSNFQPFEKQGLATLKIWCKGEWPGRSSLLLFKVIWSFVS